MVHEIVGKYEFYHSIKSFCLMKIYTNLSIGAIKKISTKSLHFYYKFVPQISHFLYQFLRTLVIWTFFPVIHKGTVHARALAKQQTRTVSCSSLAHAQASLVPSRANVWELTHKVRSRILKGDYTAGWVWEVVYF